MSLKKIAIVGPESTGKSELAQALAGHYKTSWVPEVARDYLEHLNLSYHAMDVEQIARLQLETEDKIATETTGYLFCDTNLVVIKIWMLNAFGHCPDWILDSIKSRQYDIYLLTDIDLPWQPDPLREHPNERQFFMDWYRKELDDLGVRYHIISGIGIQRVEMAMDLLKEM